MTREKRIINYVNAITNKMVTIDENAAKTIISIVESSEGKPFAKLYKEDWNSGKATPKPVRTVFTTQEKIDQALSNYVTPVFGFYRWDLYDDNAKFITNIYTINPLMF